MIRSFVLAASFAILAATGAQAASAAKMHVTIGDVNLADPAGQAVVMGRIQAAAAAVCGPVAYSLDVRGSEVFAAQEENARCIRNAAAGAVAQLRAAGYAMHGAPAATRLAGN